MFGHKKGYYTNQNRIEYYSSEYDKFVTVPEGYKSDGATGAFDVCNTSWMVHDKLCDTGIWDDGTPCTNIQASTVLSTILKDECGRWFRAFTWKWMTFAFGGGEARKNGMFKLKNKVK